ncbi:ribosomal protein S18-alanine N-acetyltransferase [Staphylococcus lugdunensis]|nr:ribosomal protein S18-alanine N-acetyltransferase [Staphylococcus lugdunensis]MCH8648090.1 ribosomal protein S18-alanine N-acetyltransferase [Staphylococcus lugdunensis]
MAESATEQLNIREMIVDDVPQVFDIERLSFKHSSWTIDAFYHEITQNQYAKYFVAERNGQIIGYLGLWTVLDQAQVTTVAVSEIYRNLGLGQLLLKYGMTYAARTCDTMSLEVRVDNIIAQHVYEKLGFQYGGKRKNYYGDGEDALVMWVKLHE